MNRIIYLRHGKKAYKNSKGPKGQPKHDSPLEKNCILDIEKITNLLIDCYGFPDLIIVSPYLRTRETGYLMQKFLEEKGTNVKLKVSKNIGEYLGNQKPIGGEACLSDCTKEHIKPKLGIETYEEFRDRSIAEFLKFKRRKEENIWVITHGLMISCVYEYLEKSPFKKVKELRGFCHEKDGSNTCKIDSLSQS